VIFISRFLEKDLGQSKRLDSDEHTLAELSGYRSAFAERTRAAILGFHGRFAKPLPAV